MEFSIKEVRFLVNPEMVSVSVQDEGASALFCPATHEGYWRTGDGPKKCVANRDSPVRDNMAFLDLASHGMSLCLSIQVSGLELWSNAHIWSSGDCVKGEER